MINATGWSPLAVIFSWTGSALVGCWPEVLVCTAIGILAALMHEELDLDYKITLEGHTLGIFPVAFGLVFRTGMSYNRFFEGRGHCGKFVHSARTLCRRARTHLISLDKSDQPIPEVVDFKKKLSRYLRLFAIFQRHSIRHTEGEAALAEAMSQDPPLLLMDEKSELQSVKKNWPQQVLIWISKEIVQVKPYMCHPDVLIWMEESTQNLLEAWMGMHKLATTPMPFPFVQMLMLLMYIWMFTLPFPLASQYGWASPPVTMLLGLSLFGLNAIGAELEDPMGEETNDLPYEVFEGAVAGATKVCKLDQLPLGGHVQSSMPAVSPPPANEWFKAKPVIAALSPTKSPMQFANSSASMSPPLNLSELGPLSPASPGSLSAEQQQAHEQFGTVSSLAELDDSTRTQLKELFARYDIDNSETIEFNELKQLTTNVCYQYKLGKVNRHFQACIEQNIAQDIHWNLDQFVTWFLTSYKTIHGI